MSDYERLRTTFTAMSWTPDVPSNALAPNEFNNGLNVESDVRGLKKVGGELSILSQIPGHCIYVDGGFRNQSTWVFIVATREGKWYMVTSSGITNITPGYGANPNASLSGYSDVVNIVSSWVGQVFFINDGIHSPMYFLPTRTEINLYDSAPDNYIWNYDIGVASTTAQFVRNYSSPNVGNILVAGNLSKTYSATGVTTNYPTTIRWSQAFANTGLPSTWMPTLNNVANEQEIPVRGPIIDGFFLGNNFYICSYWDTVVMAPISYQSSTAPVFAFRLFNQGRGLLQINCWANTDSAVYGIDARDIWIFDGTNFNPLGNQKVRDWFYKNLNPNYIDRINVMNNTYKNQIEIYFPDLTSSNGWCNKMLAWRYDLNVWNAPKTINNAAETCESPILQNGTFNLASRTVSYVTGGTSNAQITQTNIGTSFNGAPIYTLFERTNLALQSKDGPVPYGSKVYVHRILPEISGTGTVNITVGGANSTAQTPTYGQTGTVSVVTDTPWVTTQQNQVRTVAIKVESNNATDAWNLTALNLQATIVEDAF